MNFSFRPFLWFGLPVRLFTKGVRSLFFRFGHFSVTFSGASVTFFVTFCQTPFAGLLLRQGDLLSGHFSGVRRMVVWADVPPERKLQRGYIRMFPRNENRNEGKFACSPGTKTRKEGKFAKTTLLRNRPFVSS